MFTHSFIHFWLCWVFAACQLSPAAASGGHSLRLTSFTLQQLLPVQSRLWACRLQQLPQRMRTFQPQTRDGNPLSPLSRWILNHWTSREVRLPYSCSPLPLVILASFHQPSRLWHTPLQRLKPLILQVSSAGVISSTRGMDPGVSRAFWSSLISLPAHSKSNLEDETQIPSLSLWGPHWVQLFRW